MSDTFERSCSHWSEAGRRGMEDFYALAWVDYRHLAQALDWQGWFAQRRREAGERRLQLLDVACGSGKFPSALLRDARLAEAGIGPVDYALLDPSAFSIAEARAALAPPFVPGSEFETTLQDFRPAGRRWDVVWATHALYAVPEAELEAALARFLEALGGTGVGFIAHACEDAHYVAFYRRYLEAFRAGKGVAPYVGAERILEILERSGAAVHSRDIEYRNGAPATERSRVEGYLQRCLFDDDVSLDALLGHPVTAAWLADCRQDDHWTFRQRVKLIFVNDR